MGKLDMERVSVGDALAASSLLGKLPPESQRELASLARRRSYRKGEVVFHTGDPGDALHVVASGLVRIVVYSAAGSEKVLNLMGPGEAFGELALLDGAPRSATVEAMESTETIVVRRDDFLQAIHEDPRALDALLGVLASMIRRLTGEVTDLSTLDLRGRLAKKLIELADQHGKPVEGGVEINIPLTQESLAAMVAATRPSINKDLGWFEDIGAIRRRGRRIIVTDAAVLRRRVT
jgi:CRP/FNR family transcriptional regulator/CRP/FNR family cyclic AMP-dependent transcriptional regulator